MGSRSVFCLIIILITPISPPHITRDPVSFVFVIGGIESKKVLTTVPKRRPKYLSYFGLDNGWDLGSITLILALSINLV